MRINLQSKTFVLIGSALIMALMCLPAMAKTDYVVGLTTQSIRSVTTEQIELGFNYQLENAAKGKDYTFRIKVYQDNETLLHLAREGKLVGIFASPMVLLENLEFFNISLMFSPVLDNKTMQRYLVLVRKDAGIDQLAQLRNTNLSYCSADEVGIYYLKKQMKDKKLGSFDGFFKNMLLKKNPNLAISSVFFKETQAALVLESDFIVAAELNPQLSQQLVAIESSPQYITNLFVAQKILTGPMTEAELEAQMLTVGNAIQNRRLLQTYGYATMRKIKLEDLDSVKDLINAVKENKALKK